MPEQIYNRDAARLSREKRLAYQAAMENRVRQLGLLDEINRVADQHADEMLHSQSLKVWRYYPNSKEKPHLSVEFSDGSRMMLCGATIDETHTPSKVVKRLLGDECSKCSHSAAPILRRTSS